jgi:hypothetical protein
MFGNKHRKLNQFKMENCNFSLMLLHLQNEGTAKREVVKNDTVIMIYKNRLYHYCISTGIRYPYVPTNADLMADDWELTYMLDVPMQEMAMRNSLKELLMKF